MYPHLQGLALPSLGLKDLANLSGGLKSPLTSCGGVRLGGQLGQMNPLNSLVYLPTRGHLLALGSGPVHGVLSLC